MYFHSHRYATILKYKNRDPHDYARDVFHRIIRPCEQGIIRTNTLTHTTYASKNKKNQKNKQQNKYTECLDVLLLILERNKEWLMIGVPREDVFAATQNARLVRSAEQYYRYVCAYVCPPCRVCLCFISFLPEKMYLPQHKMRD
jgi:hypothetical protein